MKKFISLLLVSILALSLLTAQEKDDDKEENTFTETQVALTGLVPYTVETAGIIAQGLVSNRAVATWISIGSQVIADFPCMLIDPLYGVPMMAGSLTSYIGGNKIYNLYKDSPAGFLGGNFLANAGFKTNMWIPYAGYQKAREMSDSEVYKNKESLKYSDLLLAPFNPEVMKRKEVWTTVAGAAAILSANYIVAGFSNKYQDSIFTTKEAYIGSSKINPYLGLGVMAAYCVADFMFTGAGEEAMYRGIGFEEMKIKLGTTPAKIIDPVLFAALHAPGDIKNNENISTLNLLVNMSARGLITVVLDYIYDNGGLKSSSAFHMWYDTIVSVLDFAFTSGTPNAQNLTLSFEISL